MEYEVDGFALNYILLILRATNVYRLRYILLNAHLFDLHMKSFCELFSISVHVLLLLGDINRF
jgi:hypothetical protein